MQKKPYPSGLLMLLLVACLLAWYFYVGQGHIAYTMDSLTYRDVAINILNGHGFVTTNTFDTTPEFLPLLQWPPAFPALWAMISASGIPIDLAPQILCPLLFVCTLCLIFAIGTHLANSDTAGASSMLIFAAFPSGLAIFNFAWSEALFIPLTLAAFYALLRYRIAIDNDKNGFVWLAMSAIAIGLANWTRYTGVIFLPLLCLSVFFLTQGSIIRKLSISLLTSILSLLLVGPLWIRNYLATDNISGATRGGYIRYSVFRRLFDDLETLWNMVVYPLFHFDTVFYAFFGLPLLLLTIYFIWKNRQSLSAPHAGIVLAFSWAIVLVIFHLCARIFQQGIDFDYRMLAIPAPFAIVGVIALLMHQPKTQYKTLLLTIIVSMFCMTLFTEGQRIRNAIAQNLSPEWKSLAFAVVYRDLHKDFSISKKLNLGAIPSNTTILTDYRGLWIRYLTNHPAFQVTGKEQCQRLKERLSMPIVFVVRVPTDSFFANSEETPAAKCSKISFKSLD